MTSILGKREGPKLEFKSRDVLLDLAKGRLGVAVVALLNSEGGELYIGVTDEDDIAVAIEPIDNPDSERRRVYNHLVDSIEPAIEPHEVEVKVVEQAGQQFLRVSCQPEGERRPYAFVAKQGRWFTKRLDARVRNMTRQELAEHFTSAGTSPGAVSWREKAVERLGKLREGAAKRHVFWIGLEPYDDHSVPILDKRVQEICTHPDRTKQRQEGWNVVNPYAKVTRSKGRELNAGAAGEYTFLSIFDRGAISFEVPIERLHWKGPEQHIWPLALAEFPVSFFRLARKLLAEELRAGSGARRDDDCRLVAQIAIFGLRGWHLVGGGISNMRWMPINPNTDSYPDDDLATDLLHLTLRDVQDEPDWCGYRLVSKVYNAFNLGEDDVVPEFDRKLRRLVLPA